MCINAECLSVGDSYLVAMNALGVHPLAIPLVGSIVLLLLRIFVKVENRKQ